MNDNNRICLAYHARCCSRSIAAALLLGLHFPAAAEPPPSLGADMPAYQAPAGDPGASQIGDTHHPQGRDETQTPRGRVTLREALAAALLHSPALAAVAWDVRIREARAIQAGLLPNPAIEVEVENIGGTGNRESFEQSETTVWLSQLVPIGGKLGARRAVAGRQIDLAQWDYETARIDTLTRVTQAFVATLAAQQRLALLAELEEIVHAAVEAVDRQVRSSAAPSVTHARAKVVLLSVQLEQTEAKRDLVANRLALASSWGATSAVFEDLRGDLTAGVGTPPPLAALEERIEGNPDIARWISEVAERRASLSAAKAQRIPDPTVRLAGRHFNDNDDAALVLSVSLPIPVFDRNQGNTLAAAREIEKARAQREASRVAARTALGRRHQDLTTAFQQIVALRDTMVPAAVGAFEGTREAYRAGLYQYLDVLDAQRTLYDLRSRLLDALVAYHQARADVERLLGAALFEEEDRR